MAGKASIMQFLDLNPRDQSHGIYVNLDLFHGVPVQLPLDNQFSPKCFKRILLWASRGYCEWTYGQISTDQNSGKLYGGSLRPLASELLIGLDLVRSAKVKQILGWIQLGGHKVSWKFLNAEQKFERLKKMNPNFQYKLQTPY